MALKKEAVTPAKLSGASKAALTGLTGAGRSEGPGGGEAASGWTAIGGSVGESVTARILRSLLLVVFAAAALTDCRADASQGSTVLTGTVDYAVDGDTLRVEIDGGEREYVRLVGIDTPEDVKEGSPVECGSREAARSMDGLAPEGARVVLRLDSAAAEHDGYGRLLAHAFVDGHQLEVVQLRRGWAEVYRYHGQRFDGLARFEAARSQARRAGRGVWGSCGGDSHSSR